MKHAGRGKAGKNAKKCKMYKDNKTREKNKLKRILQSNGIVEARKYAKKHSIPMI